MRDWKPCISELAELIADIVRLDHESLLPDGDMVHVGTHSWAAEWVRRLTDAGIIPANNSLTVSPDAKREANTCGGIGSVWKCSRCEAEHPFNVAQCPCGVPDVS